MANIEITERFESNVIILDLEGRIIFGEGSVLLHRLLREIVERGEKNILLNFQNVTYIDSSGLGELVGGYVASKKIGGEIKLFNLLPNILEVVKLTKLNKVFEIYEDQQTAIESFEPHTPKTATVTTKII